VFTGIIEELGRVRAIQHREGGARLELASTTVLEDARVGDSIAVNGCCVTVVGRGDDWWAADAVIETLERTAFGALEVDEPVNLERPLRLSDHLGGHLVQGHVDAVGHVISSTPLADGSTRFTFSAPPEVLRYVVEKGSVAVDGISLTVAALADAAFDVAIIPHTLAVTTLGHKGTGAPVNLEADLIAKYVERLLVPTSREGTSREGN
jgi:riboflavin synthase